MSSALLKTGNIIVNGQCPPSDKNYETIYNISGTYSMSQTMNLFYDELNIVTNDLNSHQVPNKSSIGLD